MPAISDLVWWRRVSRRRLARLRSDRFLGVAAFMWLLASVDGCRKKPPPEASVASLLSSADPESESQGPPAPIDSAEAALWTVAKEGEPEDLMRLSDRVGCAGLRERASASDLRLTAVRAMEFCHDFSELPWLVDVATTSGDVLAQAALGAIDALAALPRRPLDPEDAEDVRAGCDALLKLARTTGRGKDRRIEAVRALRMLADRGCVRRSDIPTDVDAK
jgi:hypothetical protein